MSSYNVRGATPRRSLASTVENQRGGGGSGVSSAVDVIQVMSMRHSSGQVRGSGPLGDATGHDEQLTGAGPHGFTMGPAVDPIDGEAGAGQ